MVNWSTSEIPSRLLFGVSQQGHVFDAIREYVENENKKSERDLERIWVRAAERIEKANLYNEIYVNKRCKEAREYSEGNLIVKNFETRKIDSSI